MHSSDAEKYIFCSFIPYITIIFNADIYLYETSAVMMIITHTHIQAVYPYNTIDYY